MQASPDLIRFSLWPLFRPHLYPQHFVPTWCLAHPPATWDQVDLGTSIQQSHKHLSPSSCLPEVLPAHSSFFLKATEVGEEMEGASRSLCIYFQFQGASHHWVQQASFRCFLTTQSSVTSVLTPLFQLWDPLTHQPQPYCISFGWGVGLVAPR